jgi:hypothetical protein
LHKWTNALAPLRAPAPVQAPVAVRVAAKA